MNRAHLLTFTRSLVLLATWLLVSPDPVHSQRPTDGGTVWFYRDTDLSPLDPTLFKIVPSFAERLAVLKPDSYFAVDLPVGVHRFSWTAAPAKGETLSVALTAGEQVFVKVRFRAMERAEEREATRRMQSTQPITSPLAFDLRVSRREFESDPTIEVKRDAPPAREVAPPPDAALPLGSAPPLSLERVESATILAKSLPAPDHTSAPSPISVIGNPDAPMTNDDVLMLIEAGLSRELVMAKIKSSKTAFDTSASELVVLKKAGVHESIILMMIGTTAAPAAGGNSASSASVTTVVTATAPTDSGLHGAASTAPGPAGGEKPPAAPVASTAPPPSLVAAPPPPPPPPLPSPTVSAMARVDMPSTEVYPAPAPLEKTAQVSNSGEQTSTATSSIDRPASDPSAGGPRRLAESPGILSQPQVDYPEEARRDGVEGLVELDVVMQPNGAVVGVQLISSPHPSLSETALRSVSQWRFEPIRDINDPRSNVIFRVVVKFAIE